VKRLALLLAACATHPQAAPPCEQSLGLSAAECKTAMALRLDAELPPSPGNRFADDEAAATLGFKLFFDSDFGTGVGCATCHEPTFSFADRKAVSVGKGTGTRNAPSVFNAARLSVFFWDGRADSLWSQPLFAVQNPLEMGSSLEALAARLESDPTLNPLFVAAFGGFPSADDSDRVNEIAALYGKALEAYMRKIASGDSALDRYLDGDHTALSDAAKKGLATFVKSGCAGCHAGSALTDQQFHDAALGGAPDSGREGGAPILDANRFNLAGPYSDTHIVPDTSDRAYGAFRTPSLRNVAKTPPYGHAGDFTSLSALLTAHAPGVDRDSLIAFLLALDGDYPPLPWSDWPSRQ
jgi:cytochrome c peroxidase